MKNIKDKLSSLVAFLLFPVFILGVIVSDFIWARLAGGDRKAGILRLFETPKHSAQAGGSATTSGDGDCFPSGTLVAVAGFLGRYMAKKIEDVRQGDRVLAMDFPSGKIRRLTVSQPIRWDSPGHPFVEVSLESGMKIVSTSIHPFVINDKNETRQAWKLRPGDTVLVLGRGTKWEKVVELKSFERKEPVYNLELDAGPHNYFASLDGLRFALVHNLKKDGDDTSGSTSDTGTPGPGCFKTGARVATRMLAGGEFESKPIEEIRPGEEVLSLKFEAGAPEIVPRRVVKVSRHPVGGWPSVEFTMEGGATIIATDNHPMVVDEKNRVIPAADITAGAALCVAASPARWERVREARKFIDTAAVYNIELSEDPRNYLVSLDGRNFVLAHNEQKM